MFSQRPTTVSIASLFFLGSAELIVNFADELMGLLLYCGYLLFLFMYVSFDWEENRFVLALSLIPLIRILSFALPLSEVEQRYFWYLALSISLFVPIVLLVRRLDITLVQASAPFEQLTWQLLVILVSPGLGYIYYLIASPEPLIDELTLREALLPGFILMICLGLLEEVIFRGIIQQSLVDIMGPANGIYTGAVSYALLHIGHSSVFILFFALVISIAFGFVAFRSSNIWGVAIAHGLMSISAFLIFPNL